MQKVHFMLHPCMIETKAVACFSVSWWSRMVFWDSPLLRRRRRWQAEVVHLAFLPGREDGVDVVDDSWYFWVPTTRSTPEVLEEFLAPALSHAAHESGDEERDRAGVLIMPIFPSAFCSAWSRTEQVLMRMTSASDSSRVTV